MSLAVAKERTVFANLADRENGIIKRITDEKNEYCFEFPSKEN